jgi:predicted nucleic acid-binding protein
VERLGHRALEIAKLAQLGRIEIDLALIAATSVVHNVPLVTRDKALLKSKQVPLARAAAR